MKQLYIMLLSLALILNLSSLTNINASTNKGTKVVRTEYDSYGKPLADFNKDGNKIKEYFYDVTKGYSPRTYKVNQFDENNKRIKTEEFYQDGTLKTYSTPEYDKKGRVKKENYYYIDGEAKDKIKEFISYEYDEKNRITKEHYYSISYKDKIPQEELYYFYSYEYDNNGNLIKKSKCNYIYEYDDNKDIWTRKNQVEKRDYIIYEYDNRNKLTVVKKHNDGGLGLNTSVKEHSYSNFVLDTSVYNAKGYLIQKNYSNINNPPQVIGYLHPEKINIFKYDDKGKLIKIEDWTNYKNRDGGENILIEKILSSYSIPEYNELGNIIRLNKYYNDILYNVEDYDNRGNLIKSSYYSNDNLTHYYIYEYSYVKSYEGKKITEKHYNADGSIYTKN